MFNYSEELRNLTFDPYMRQSDSPEVYLGYYELETSYIIEDEYSGSDAREFIERCGLNAVRNDFSTSALLHFH